MRISWTYPGSVRDLEFFQVALVRVSDQTVVSVIRTVGLSLDDQEVRALLRRAPADRYRIGVRAVDEAGTIGPVSLSPPFDLTDPAPVAPGPVQVEL